MAHSEIQGPFLGPEGDPQVVRAIRNALAAGDVGAVLRHLAPGQVRIRVTGDPTIGGGLLLRAIIEAPASDAGWGHCTRVELAVAWVAYAQECRAPIPRAVRRSSLGVHMSSKWAFDLVHAPLDTELGCRLAWALQRRPPEGDPAPVQRAAALRWDTPLEEIFIVRAEVGRAIEREVMGPRIHALRTAARWARVAGVAALVHELLE